MSIPSMEKKLELEKKLQMLFQQLNTIFPIEDDTVLQKVQSTLRGLINKQENPLIWCKKIGLISFVTDALNTSYISEEKNHPLTAFALSCFSSVVENENIFMALSEDKVMTNLRGFLYVSHSNMSLIANTLLVFESLIKHQEGLQWVIRYKIWKKYLPFIKSQNIFIKKSCTKVLIAILLNFKSSQLFKICIHDLEHLLCGSQEDSNNTRLSTINYEANFDMLSFAKFESSTQDILQFFHNFLVKALGKKSVYTVLKPLHDFCFQVLHQRELNMSSEAIIMITKLLILIIIDKNLDFVSDIRFCKIEFDSHSFRSDTLNLMECLTSRGYHHELNRSSFEMYKYWSYVTENYSGFKLGESQIVRKESYYSLETYDDVECEVPARKNTLSLPYVPDFFIFYHILPLHALWCKTFGLVSAVTDKAPDLEEYEKWQDLFYFYKPTISFLKDQDVQAKIDKQEQQLLQNIFQNSQGLEEQCTSQLLNFSSVLDHLNVNCASYLVKLIIVLLKWKVSVRYLIDSDTRLYIHLLSLLRSLIERFEIKWYDIKEADSLHISLCNLIGIRGINTRVKVITFQTMKACIVKSAHSWRCSEDYISEHTLSLENDYYFHLLKTASSSLSDTEWEVRDSALEVIREIMLRRRYESEPFSELVKKCNIVSLVLQAVGDTEPYVQASALLVLSSFVCDSKGVWYNLMADKEETRGFSCNKILDEMKGKEIKMKALRAVVKSGEVSIRRNALRLLWSLVYNLKFQKEEIKKFVIPVVQSTCNDSDDEVRLYSIKILNRILFYESDEIGSLLRRVTGTAIDCISADLNQILDIFTRFCRNDCFRCIVNRIDDNVERVSKEAKDIARFLFTVAEESKLQDKFVDNLRSKKFKSSYEESNEVLRPQNHTSLETANSEIIKILQTSDLAVISKLKTRENNWWDFTPDEEYLNPDEIPPLQSTYINENVLIDIIENGPETIKSMQTNKDDESFLVDEMHMLLEDIFLVIRSPNLENKSRAQDCY